MAGSEAGNTLHHAPRSPRGGRLAASGLAGLAAEIAGASQVGLEKQVGVRMYGRVQSSGVRWSWVWGKPVSSSPDFADCWPCP